MGEARKKCQQCNPGRWSCTWNILLSLQKSLDPARNIYNLLACWSGFFLYWPSPWCNLLPWPELIFLFIDSGCIK
ncbi:hypothetical protein F9C28_04390 [Shimwellia pseudoproteus]|nr:hypothetical protein [Shimwellia pseudoproteus]